MQVEHALDADAVRRVVAGLDRAVQVHRAELDALNVFPVADADTGTNLGQTLAAARDALDATSSGGPGALLKIVADAAVLAARGNSGVIVSQVFAGLAGTASGPDDPYGATELAEGLRAAARLARAAVADPAEGTVLTVLDAAASAVPPIDPATGVGEVLTAALRAGDAALLTTPATSAAQGRPAVVDAGGRGLLIMLAAMADELDPGANPDLSIRTPAARPAAALVGDRETGHERFGYEVQYLLDSDADHVARLRSELARLGDSVAIAPAPSGVWNVHVHVDDIGAALEAGIAAGRPHQVTVVRFADRPSAHHTLDTSTSGHAGSAVVAVAPGAGLAHLFEAEGVGVVDPSDDDPTSAVLDAVRAAGAAEVILLPNASQVTGVAEAAAERARADGIRVAVVPTRSPVQGLAAVAVHDPARPFDDDVVAMAEAAAATRFAEITIARREALTTVGMCRPGDVLGLIDGEVVAIGRGVMAVSLGVLDRLLGVGAELVTVLTGRDAPPSLGDLVARHVAERAPLTEVSVYVGGQPDLPLIIGAE